MMKNIILSTMLNFIGKNYGSQEMEEPCYDMEKMAIKIEQAIKEKESEIIDNYEL